MKKKLGIVNRLNPRDRYQWGRVKKRMHTFTAYNMMKVLQKYYDVQWVEYSMAPLPKTVLLADRAWHRYLSRKRHMWLHTFLYAKNIAKAIDKSLGNSSLDVLFAPKGSAEVAFLQTGIPVVYHSDATFELVLDYLGPYKNMSKRSVVQGDEIERKAMHKAAHVMLTTEWARESALRYYQVPASKVTVVPSAGDLVRVPEKQTLRWERSGDTCQLLFVGVDWEGKGGPIALRTLELLLTRGVDAHLTIVGSSPPSSYRHEQVTVVPFLNKHDPAENRRFEALFRRADFFLLPTRAECGGICWGEAAAFALPSVTTDTGGVGGYVQEGINGILLPAEDVGEGYARAICDLWHDRERYRMLRRSTREKYEKDLNWETWGQRARQIFDSLC